MKYFEQDFINFFNELKENNHKEWFHANKKRYEKQVKNAFASSVSAIIDEIQKYDPEMVIEAKDCILRINRDIRFAKDKTPYNLHVTAFISRGGRKDKSIPGFFVRFSPDMVGIMGGCFGPSTDQLAGIRDAISQDPAAFRKIIEEKKFKAAFGEIKGDAIKRIPKDLKAAVEQEPLVANKQFYCLTELGPDLLLSEKLIPELMKYWHIMRPFNDYLVEAMG